MNQNLKKIIFRLTIAFFLLSINIVIAQDAESFIKEHSKELREFKENGSVSGVKIYTFTNNSAEDFVYELEPEPIVHAKRPKKDTVAYYYYTLENFKDNEYDEYTLRVTVIKKKEKNSDDLIVQDYYFYKDCIALYKVQALTFGMGKWYPCDTCDVHDKSNYAVDLEYFSCGKIIDGKFHGKGIFEKYSFKD